MIIGVDFDNTIVCYDNLFYNTALDKGIIPKNLSMSKNSVRDYLRDACRENEWIELQGYIYGPGIFNAKPFEGVRDFFEICREKGLQAYIISHRTLNPYMGPKYDLHKYARQWLKRNRFYDGVMGLKEENIFFELTGDKKIERIKIQKCTHFIDDLPEFLNGSKFPTSVKRMLFDPSGEIQNGKFRIVRSWHQIIEDMENL